MTTPETTTTTDTTEGTNPFDTMTNQQILGIFIWLMNNKIDVVSKFEEDEHGIVTHQSLEIYCGDLMASTDPSELEKPMVALASCEDKKTVN